MKIKLPNGKTVEFVRGTLTRTAKEMKMSISWTRDKLQKGDIAYIATAARIHNELKNNILENQQRLNEIAESIS